LGKRGGIGLVVRMKFLDTNCPSCGRNIRFKEKISLISRGYISCEFCKANLTASILSSVLGTCILGVPSWLITDHFLSSLNLPDLLDWLIGFSVCMGVGQLTYPVANLVEVRVE